MRRWWCAGAFLTPLLAPGEEGFRDTIMIEAIYRSAAVGNKVKV
jgi:hypothetical protein